MTKIKLCGLSRACDIEAANIIKPEYIGFVFAPKSKRYVTEEKAEALKSMLAPEISAVGVFVNEDIQNILRLLDKSVIDAVQLHGTENEEYITRLKDLTDKPVIKAFAIESEDDVAAAEACSADYVLLDCGRGGTGKSFDWSLACNIKRDYFLAGGLNVDNVSNAVKHLKPFAVDVSSGIESNGYKDINKMKDFANNARKENI